MYDVASIIGGTIALFTGLVWLVRLEGRLNAHDVLFEERKHLIDERQVEIAGRLTRIEAKIDKGFNGYTLQK